MEICSPSCAASVAVAGCFIQSTASHQGAAGQQWVAVVHCAGRAPRAVHAEGQRVGGGNVDERLIGAWELVATERRDAQGNVVGEALPGYVGQIMYSADGHVSAHLMGPGRPALADDNRPAWSMEGKAAAFETYIGYYGTYSVDDVSGMVTHHVHGAVSPAMVGSDQRRAFRLEGDRLILSPPPRVAGGERSYIVWQRCRRP